MLRARFVLFTVFVSVALLTRVSNAAAPLPSPGDHVLTFAGVAQTENDPAPNVLFLRSIQFMAVGYVPIAEIRLLDPQAKPLLGSGWSGPGPRDSMSLKSGAEGEIRCTIPTKAAGIILDYTCPDYVSEPIVLKLKGSNTLLQPIQHQYDCCVFLQRGMSGVGLASRPPAYNMWSVNNVAPGPQTHGEIQMKIETANGNDPISCGEYRLHVWARKDPEDEQYPNVQGWFRLDGVDLSRYDGFVASAIAPHQSSGSASLLDKDNYSWGGGGVTMEPGKWAQWAVPFSACRTSASAMGDGVLKLTQLRGLLVYVGWPPEKLTTEYIVGMPRFWSGNPPADVPLIGVDARKGRRAPMEELVPLPMERRKAMFFDGIGIQSISIQGDSLWLGTDAGLIRTSKSKPGLQSGRWTVNEGMVDDDVHSVHADGNDVWVGTTGGLSRFDGSSFKNFTAQNGLLPGPAMAVTSTADEVWIGQTRGLARFDKKTQQITSFKRSGGWAPESTGGQGIPIQEGRGVYADVLALDDQDGTLWHGAAGIGRSDRAGNQLDSQHGTTSRAIGIYPDGENLWYVSAGEIVLQHKNGKQIEDFHVGSRLGIGSQYASSVITASAMDPSKKVLWLAYSDGVGCFEPTRGQFQWSPALSVALGGLMPQTIAADDQRLWIGTDNGLMVFDKSKAMQTWLSVDYECMADLRAAGVKLGEGSGSGRECCWQHTFIDTERAADRGGSSLCVEYTIGCDDCAKVNLCHSFKLDASGSSGISFWAMSDRPRQFMVDVKRVRDLTATKTTPADTEIWRSVINLGPRWERYTIPYDKMRLVDKESPTIHGDNIYLTGIDIYRSVKDFRCPGDTGRFWIDHLEWLPSSQAGQRFSHR